MGTERSHAADKPAWRRCLEVAVPVAMFVVIAPVAVNGLASALNSAGSRDAKATTVATAPAAPGSSAPDTSPLDTTQITVANVDPGADDKTIALASEIVAETTADPTGPAASPAANTPVTEGPATSTATVDAGAHSHGAITPEVALTRAERAALGDQLAAARTAALQYPTVADALAAGYVKVVRYVPLIGSHYIKWSLMDGTFDVTQPEMLLYDGTDPTSHIVGLSYYMFSDTEPSPFVGANDHWHQHIGLCIKDGVVIGGGSLSVADCAARGGAKANAGNGWMVHAWVVPGWESPQGVFSPEHVGLTADLPAS